MNAENVLEWISDENVANFASLSREKLKSSLIASTSAFYAKQSAAEKGGGGYDPTYRTDKIPSPVHYIEPNLKFFTELCMSWKVFQNIFERYELFDERSEKIVSQMENICLRTLNIVATEVKDEKVSKDDLD